MPFSFEQLVKYIWKNEHLDAYHTLWRQAGLSENNTYTEKDIFLFPYIDKELLKSIPIRNRIPKTKDLIFAVASTGTTQAPFITFHTRSIIPEYYTYATRNISYQRAMFLRRPTYSFSALTALSHYLQPGTVIVDGDVTDLVYSATIAKEVRVDHLVITPSLALRFAKVFQKIGGAPEQFSFLYLSGEPLTTVMRFAVSSAFPRAFILYGYGASESQATLGHASSECSIAKDISPNAYHLNTRDILFEENEKELIITVLDDMPLPLVRYRTGDRIKIMHDTPCACGFKKGPVAIVGPRTTGTSYKINLLTFHTKKISDILKKFPEVSHEHFSLYLEDMSSDGLVCLKPTITLVPAQKGLPRNPLLLEHVARAIEENLVVLPRRTLMQSINRGLSKRLHATWNPSLKGQHILPPKELRKPFQ